MYFTNKYISDIVSISRHQQNNVHMYDEFDQ